MDSPRGRIYLMRAVTDRRLELSREVRRHLDLCLDCRACESACPSGVQYGQLIEPFRAYMAKQPVSLSPGENQPRESSPPLGWLQRLILSQVFPYAARNRWALAPARWLQWSGLDGVLKRSGMMSLLPRSLRQMHEMLPTLQPHYGKLPEVLPAEGKRRARVGLFLGCVADGLYPQTNLATVRVLQKNGCEVVVPRRQGCCGALHYHGGAVEPAKGFARSNLAAFDLNSLDAVIVNAAGCGAMLKDYGHLLPDDEGRKFASRVRDISEFLVELGPLAPTHPLKIRAVYHDACHLCHAQKIRQPPRDLLALIPGLEVMPLEESEICCGAAGSYNLTQPEMAERLGERKTMNLLATGAKLVLSGNVGCLLQIGKHLRRRDPDIVVAHTIDALWASYSGASELLGSPSAVDRSHVLDTLTTAK